MAVVVTTRGAVAGREAGGTTGRSGPAGRVTPRRTVLLLLAAFAASRLAYSLAGVGFDASAFHPTGSQDVQWQLLPLNLLEHDLLRSVWYLHSQPPLYNLFCGFVLHLPPPVRDGFAFVVYLGLGAAMVVATFLLLLELGVWRHVAVAAALAVVADPTEVLYERWLSWSYPTAVLLVVGALFLVRLARTASTRWAALSAGCFSAVVLLDTTFQWPWLLLVAAGIGYAGRARFRQVVRAGSIPLLIVGGWCLKDAVQFGTVGTSSWLGMNLDQSTLAHAPGSEVRRLIGDGRLDPLAAVPPFQPIGTYEPRFLTVRPSGVPALDQPVAELGVPNYNNRAYLSLSRRFLGDDLAYIQARPGRYLRDLSVSAELWTIPGDQFAWLSRNRAQIAGYARWYDAVVLLQPRFAGYKTSLAAQDHNARPAPGRLSWTGAAVTLIDLVVAPVAIFRRRRDALWPATGAVLWATVAYSFAVTTATELGENMRFHFELGTLPLVLAVATVAVLVPKRGRSGGGSGEPHAQSRPCTNLAHQGPMSTPDQSLR